MSGVVVTARNETDAAFSTAATAGALGENPRDDPVAHGSLVNRLPRNRHLRGKPAGSERLGLVGIAVQIVEAGS